jgi:hypothetical protein
MPFFAFKGLNPVRSAWVLSRCDESDIGIIVFNWGAEHKPVQVGDLTSSKFRSSFKCIWGSVRKRDGTA